MATCEELLDGHITETGRASHARDQLIVIGEERAALLQQANGAEAEVNESKGLLDTVNGEIARLTADQEAARLARFEEIEDLIFAIDQRLEEIDRRINAILALLAGGIESPLNPEQVSAFEAEAAALQAEAAALQRAKEALQAERLALTGGVGDPGGLQPAIDALVAERDETARLLQEATEFYEGILADLIANDERRQEQEDIALDAQRRADALLAEYEANGCDDQ